MNLKEFLLERTNVGDLVVFKQDGWQIGCTIIDNEDLFIGSLNPILLRANVKTHEYTVRDWTIKPVIDVELNRNFPNH